MEGGAGAVHLHAMLTESRREYQILRAGVAGGCEPRSMDAENQAWVFCKKSK